MNVNINLSKGKNVWHPQKYLKELKAIYRPSVTMEELKRNNSTLY